VGLFAFIAGYSQQDDETVLCLRP